MAYLQFDRVAISEAALAPVLEQTGQDGYFGKDNRCRSMSRLKRTVDGLETLAKKPLFQSSDINPINNYGGIRRSYDDLPADLRGHPDFHALVDKWLALLPEPAETFSVHHIRTKAGGDPTPEGRHRDGYQYVGIAVLQRKNIDGDSGVTSFWARGQGERVFHQVLQPGELCVFDDREYLHATSCTAVAAESEDGVRDVLIFTYPEHGEILERGEVQ